MESGIAASIIFDAFFYLAEVTFTLVTGVCIFIVLLLRYWLIHSSPPIHIYGRSALYEALECVGFCVPSYKPTFWLTSGNAQTFWSALTQYGPSVDYVREMLNVHAYQPGRYDGIVALDWVWDYKSLAPDVPTVIVLHGLTGGSSESYVRKIVHSLNVVCGFRVVVFNARGCGGSELASPQAFNAAYTDDLRQVVNHVCSRFSQSPTFAVGFSLGANILTKYLGEEGTRTPIRAALSVATPFNTIVSDEHLHSTWFKRRIYSGRLAHKLVSLFADTLSSELFESVSWLDDENDERKMRGVESLRDFDERLTRKSFGYESLNHYYSDARSDVHVKNIRTPTLFVSSRDDPICAFAGIPMTDVTNNDKVMLIATECGGHSMDWFEGTFTCQPGSWLNRVACNYFQCMSLLYKNNDPCVVVEVMRNDESRVESAKRKESPMHPSREMESVCDRGTSTTVSGLPVSRVVKFAPTPPRHHHANRVVVANGNDDSVLSEELALHKTLRDMEGRLDEIEKLQFSQGVQWGDYKVYLNELISRCDAIELKYLSRLLDVTEEMDTVISDCKQLII